MAGTPARRERREREAKLFADADGTMAAACEAVASGPGLNAWCTARDVAYSRVVAWIEADANRARELDAAFRARADLAGSAIETIAHRLVDPAADTAHPWVTRRTRKVPDESVPEGFRDEPVEIDSKAARVAMAGFQWLAEKQDRTRFGKVTEHHHTHAVQFEHLAALRQVLSAAPSSRVLPALPGPAHASARAEPAVDAAFRVLESTANLLMPKELRPHPTVVRIGLRRTLPSAQWRSTPGGASRI